MLSLYATAITDSSPIAVPTKPTDCRSTHFRNQLSLGTTVVATRESLSRKMQMQRQKQLDRGRGRGRGSARGRCSARGRGRGRCSARDSTGARGRGSARRDGTKSDGHREQGDTREIRYCWAQARTLNAETPQLTLPAQQLTAPYSSSAVSTAAHPPAQQLTRVQQLTITVQQLTPPYSSSYGFLAH